MSDSIRHLFNAIAPQYDFLNSLLSFQIDRLWRRQGVKALAQRERFSDILDLCAGTLALSKTLLKENPSARVTAVDFSENMLKKGESLLTPAEKSRIRVRVGDVLTFDLPESSYDGVMVAYGLRNVSNNPLVLQNIHRWLRPGGRLVILEFFKPTAFFPKLFNLTYAEVVIPILGAVVSRNKAAYEHLRDSVRQFYTTQEYKKLLEQTGFKDIRIMPQTGGISHRITAEKP